MTINWFTVIAQLVNFFILVALLKRFLYKPILNAIAEREKKIIDELEDAASKVNEAEKEKEEFRQKNLEFDLQRKEKWEIADREIRSERQLQIDRVRHEVKELKKRLQESMREEKETMRLHLQKMIHEEVFAIASQTLKDLAGLSMEQSILQGFMEKLNSLNEKDRDKLRMAFAEDKDAFEIKSAFGLSEEQQKSLREALKKILNADVRLNFMVEATLISGISISRNGFKLAWSISDYLNKLENIAGTLNDKISTTFTEPK